MNDIPGTWMGGPILVTGGTGDLGRRVVRRLVGHDAAVRVLSRHGGVDEPGVHHYVGDTVHGRGMTEAMDGADVVVHLAGGATGDDVAAGHVARAARAAGVSHLVLISVVGADAMPIGYFRAKAAAERAVADSGVPFSIVRAAQFHDFVLHTVGVMARLPIVPAPGELRLEPVAAEEVADVVAGLALAGPRGRVADIAGPEVLEIRQIIATLRAIRGKHPRMMTVRLPGAVGRAYRDGRNLAASGARRGNGTWEQFLAETVSLSPPSHRETAAR
ncbi:SDR family oxidoreductase [Glaciihabitans sp. dw_435]|uniref:SDR family oxidoreductase n=1 Tax=Glaciihabitans sp. dw_435 TaxID=2720081 RepID=UPI002103B5C6|nr:SDR family oxidoreductase [Glaciihabitans sp. dw_435]